MRGPQLNNNHLHTRAGATRKSSLANKLDPAPRHSGAPPRDQADLDPFPRPGTGRQSAGIAHVAPIFIAPGIRPSPANFLTHALLTPTRAAA